MQNHRVLLELVLLQQKMAEGAGPIGLTAGEVIDAARMLLNRA